MNSLFCLKGKDLAKGIEAAPNPFYVDTLILLIKAVYFALEQQKKKKLER